MEQCEYSVELEHITKRFGNYTANDDETLRLRKGEIHALLGENGAGKSTLMNILFGLIKPDEGTVKINGKPVSINNPNDATALGIGMVHQHFKQVECFTVLQNITLGAEDTKYGILQPDKARKKVLELSRKYNFDVEPDTVISDLTVGQQQKVEILKMLYRDNDVLIFDEPTAVLTPNETEELLKLMKQFAQSGKSILFISHKLNEIRAVANRCTVLRKGKYAGTVDIEGTTEESLSELMVGRKVQLVLDKKPSVPGEAVLSVRDLSVLAKHSGKYAVRNVSFDVHEGEIVCIAGIDGNGQSELSYAVSGVMPVKEGKVLLRGKDITDIGIKERTAAGLSVVHEDRLKYSFVAGSSLMENMILKAYDTPQFSRAGFLKYAEADRFTKEKIEDFDIRAAQGPATNAGGMSGGNQQKAVIARELSGDPDLFIAAQPIRGLDVGAIEYIHKKLLQLREERKAILLFSFELSEVMNLSDRILVMFEGEIVADLVPEKTTLQELGLYMAGAKKAKGGTAE